MKTIIKYSAVIVLFFLFTALSGCIPEVQDEIGTAVFHISIAGYTEEGEKTVSMDLQSLNQEKSVSRSVALDSDYTASSYFTDLNPGIWDVTVQLLNDGSVVGSHSFSFDIFLDETTTNQIEGVYSDGILSFTVTTADPNTVSAIQINENRAVLVEARRYWDDSRTNPEQLARIDARGELSSMKSCTVVYPDGYRFSIGPDARGNLSFQFEQWEDSTGENGFYVDRMNYFASGTYFASAYDNNNLGDSFSFNLNKDENGLSSPAVTAPLQGQSIDSTVSNDIRWSYQKNFEIRSTLIFVVQNSTSSLVFSKAVSGTSTNSVTLPAFMLAAGTAYNLLIFGVDQNIPPSNPSNPDNELLGFTDSSNYSFDDIFNQLYTGSDPKLMFIGSARLNFSTL